jgi:ABC-type multidrug transport system ATPase subunit
LTVLENVTYTLEALGVPYEERHERAVARLRELDLVGEANRRPAEMPAHAVKRLALARALVTDAPLIVLDEIDLGLDHEHAARMIDALGKLRERTRCTILLTTHNLELARTIADRLAILVRGRIVAAGSPATLLNGVKTSEDFDRIYEFSEVAGPLPQLEDAEANSERKRRRLAKTAKFNVDPIMITVAVIGVVIILAAFLLTHSTL